MTRLTRSEIETRFLRGEEISWKNGPKKTLQIQLTEPSARRLFGYILSSNVRKPNDLPESFVEGLLTTFAESHDPAAAQISKPSQHTNEQWRLHAVETEGFGGLNSWNGNIFRYELDGESLLLEGANGSGKSSFAASIIWALTGDRPRDQADGNAHNKQPVFASDDRLAGDWPPIASYPHNLRDLEITPDVRVTLEMKSTSGNTAIIERRLSNERMIFICDPAFAIEPILIEAGILMPARLAQMKMSGGGGRLTEAVQKLTGLDDLISIGQLAEGLCHKGREFQSYRSKELAVAKAEFRSALALAQQALTTVDVALPAFTTSDTTDPTGDMASFGKYLKDQAAELASVIAKDISSTIDLKSTTDQNSVISSIGAAEADLKAGIEGIPFWKVASTVSSELGEFDRARLSDQINKALSDAENAKDLLLKSKKDSKFRLKALATNWHTEHKSGEISNCPLCSEKLSLDLSAELETLRSAGLAATRTFEDNTNAIISSLDAAIPSPIRRQYEKDLIGDPRASLIADIRKKLTSNDRYSSSLVKLTEIVNLAIEQAPSSAAPPIASEFSLDTTYPTNLRNRIETAQRLLDVAQWFDLMQAEWRIWWNEATSSSTDFQKTKVLDSEKLIDHLSRLSEALSKAEPFRKAAEAMRNAWINGTRARQYEEEISKRNAIGESLAPLKSLGSLCESVARNAINELSDRVEKLLEGMLFAENFKFQSTDLNRKTGLVVRGGFTPEVRIDATLVANTSWLRALLWCFVFALRDEAVQQLGKDPFPIVVLDDPQSTFDTYHRARWAQYVASLQHGPSAVQVVLTTHEELFIDLAINDGIVGRQAIISAAEPPNRATILEGASLERRWKKALSEKTASAAVDYLDRSRVFVEGVMKVMLRGEAPKVHGLLLGQLRDLLRQLNAAGKAPWDAPVFTTLLGQLEGGRPEIKYLEGAHHTTGHHFGMQEGDIVEKFFRKELCPRLERAYRAAREHRLLHGGMKALHAPPPATSLPEGYRSKLRNIPLTILGRAAALTNGRVADGSIDMVQLTEAQHKTASLKNHQAFRLSARTLEPVARPGDILITRETNDPSDRSLVVAVSNDRILARRFEISHNQSDIAVLTAQSVNPREIAAPIVALKSTLTLHKIVGVLFSGSQNWSPGIHEVVDCGGEAQITNVTSSTLGLVEVSGNSAEPLALDGQFLIVRKEVSPQEACIQLNSSPIIAEDSGGHCYFKRLHSLPNQQVVLESLEIGGDYPPIVLNLSGQNGQTLNKVWPVAGVLFELPK